MLVVTIANLVPCLWQLVWRKSYHMNTVLEDTCHFEHSSLVFWQPTCPTACDLAWECVGENVAWSDQPSSLCLLDKLSQSSQIAVANRLTLRQDELFLSLWWCVCIRACVCVWVGERGFVCMYVLNSPGYLWVCESLLTCFMCICVCVCVLTDARACTQETGHARQQTSSAVVRSDARNP